MNTNIIEMQSVVKSFTGKLALNRLDFSLASGKIVGLLGRNGAGKSTLMECVLGLRGIQAGTIALCGDDPNALSQATRGRLGYVPQQTDLFGWMTAPQMLSFFKAFYPVWNDNKTNALLDRWSISRTTLISRLSGGEKQRLAIIRALAHEPDVLILDEPVASLDPAGRRDFLRELVDSVIARNATVLFSTHILTDLERVAVDVAMMKSGKILLQAELDTLSAEAVRLTGTEPSLKKLQAYLLTNLVVHGVTATAVARIPAAEQAQLRVQHPEITIEHMSLEDFFIEVTA